MCPALSPGLFATIPYYSTLAITGQLLLLAQKVHDDVVVIFKDHFALELADGNPLRPFCVVGTFYFG